MRVAGARIIVTGASTGIGRDVAQLLARKGAHVWGFARDGARLAQLEGVTPVVGDVSNDLDRARLVETVGHVDVLINNAGIGVEGLTSQLTADDVRRMYEINVIGLIDLTQRVLPQMLERGAGQVINVSSVAGWAAGPPLGVYSSTKWAVTGFTDGLRREVKAKGVDVTLIAPGPIKTEFNARATTGAPADTPGALDSGLPASAVSRAIVRAITRAGRPGYDIITVPRVAGLVRLGSMPGIRIVADRAVRGQVSRLEG